MKVAISRRILGIVLLFICLVAVMGYEARPTAAQNTADRAVKTTGQFTDWQKRVADGEEVMLVLQLALPDNLRTAVPESPARQAAIATAQDQLSALNGVTVNTRYQILPNLAITVDETGLKAVVDSPLVMHVQENLPEPLLLGSSTGVIGMPTVWGNGYDGSGQTVVVLDNGIDNDHPFFGSRIVTEACFSKANNSDGNPNTTSLCPSGGGTETGAGASDAMTTACLDGGGTICDHGTHVAGIAAGADAGTGYDGVARGANIISIQVFTRFDDSNCNPASPPCTLAYNSDQLAALEYVYNTLRNSYDIASVNMSLGGGQNFGACDSDIRATVIGNLRTAGIATVIASGNSGYKDSVGAPACISDAVTVGSTTDADSVSSFSNIGPQIDLLAPGSSIDSAVPDDGYANYNGTSMATPHVAGAWAVLKQIDPTATVDEIETALENTGVSVTDNRSGGTYTFPRIQVDSAANTLNPGGTPSITADAAVTSGQTPDSTMNHTLSITNTGTSTLTWTITEDNMAVSLSATPLTADAEPTVDAVEAADLTLSAQQVDTTPALPLGVSAPQATVDLILDNGAHTHDVGLGGGSYLWFNRFTPASSEFPFQLDQISVFFANGVGVNVGDNISLYLYEDTDGDGDPSNATLVDSYSATVGSLGFFNTYNLPDSPVLNGPGDVIVGIYNNTAGTVSGDQPFAFDNTGTANRSWVAGTPSGSNMPTLFGTVETISSGALSGPWLVRGYGETTDSACSSPTDIPWLSVSPGSGSTISNTTSSIGVVFDSSGLSTGVYSGTLCVDHNDGSQSQLQIPITMTLCAEPTAVPTVTVTIPAADSIHLDWNDTGAEAYEVWHADDDTYFDPGSMACTAGNNCTLVSGTTETTLSGMTAAHYGIVVRAHDSCGNHSVHAATSSSPRVGSFDFTITPGD